MCTWQGPGAIAVIYVTGEGVDAWKHGSRQSEIVPIDPVNGFPAYNLQPPTLPRHCDILGDVSAGQYIFIGVAVDADPSNACSFARELTESILTNLAGG